MSKLTKEEISLCKQVAERYRKPIEHGDWFMDMKIGGKPFLSLSLKVPIGNLIPLWTISDCLEFLQEREDVIELVITGKHLRWFFRWGNRKMRSGKTPLAACLKAVLAVLEEE